MSSAENIINILKKSRSIPSSFSLNQPQLKFNPKELFAFFPPANLPVFSGGFWAVFITNASEQFGTNLRATAASTIPSLVRGLFIPIAMSFKFLKTPEQFGNPINAAAIVGIVCISLAFWASFTLEETFDKDLDNLEY